MFSLLQALFSDADVDRSGTITFEELKGQLDRNPGLLDNLTVRWVNDCNEVVLSVLLELLSTVLPLLCQ